MKRTFSVVCGLGLLILLVCGACDRKWKSGKKSWAEGGLPEPQLKVEAKTTSSCASMKPIGITVPMQQLENRTRGRIEAKWLAQLIPVLACKHKLNNEEVLDVITELETTLNQKSGYTRTIVAEIFTLSAEYSKEIQPRSVAKLITTMRHDLRYQDLEQAAVLASTRAIIAGVLSSGAHTLRELTDAGGYMFPLPPFFLDEPHDSLLLTRQALALALSEPGNVEVHLKSIYELFCALPTTSWAPAQYGGVLSPTIERLLVSTVTGKTASMAKLPWLKGAAKEFMSPIFARFQEALTTNSPKEAAEIAMAKYTRVSADMEAAYALSTTNNQVETKK